MMNILFLFTFILRYKLFFRMEKNWMRRKCAVHIYKHTKKLRNIKLRNIKLRN